MTREDMWEEFESQLISEVRTPITMSYNDSIRVAEIGIKEVVERWKKRLDQGPKTGYCKDCKWWKDSDGSYRRGIDAESKCPINRIEVFEGNGYCFMFEPQERIE